MIKPTQQKLNTNTTLTIAAKTLAQQQEWLNNLTSFFIKEKSKKLDAKSVATQTPN